MFMIILLLKFLEIFHLCFHLSADFDFTVITDITLDFPHYHRDCIGRKHNVIARVEPVDGFDQSHESYLHQVLRLIVSRCISHCQVLYQPDILIDYQIPRPAVSVLCCVN